MWVWSAPILKLSSHPSLTPIFPWIISLAYKRHSYHLVNSKSFKRRRPNIHIHVCIYIYIYICIHTQIYCVYIWFSIYIHFYLSIVDLQCFRYTARWFSYTNAHILFLKLFSSWVITRYWLYFPMLYSKPLLLVAYLFFRNLVFHSS